MKKLLTAVNILLLGFIMFQSCNNRQSVRDPAPEVIRELGECTPRGLGMDYDTIFDNGSLDAFLARQLSEAYANDAFKGYMNNGLGIVSRANKPDTRSIWFDLSRLKNLITTIENSVCERDCKTPIRLGVRIYLAKYTGDAGPKAISPDMRNIHSEYANRVTAFMVGTYDNAKGKHVDFDPMNVGSDKCMPIPFKKLMDSLKGQPLQVSGLRMVKSAFYKLNDTTAMNQGDLMPPPDGAGSFPTGN